MKQLFYQRGKNVKVLEVPKPVCRDNGVLVAFHYSLISSGTEIQDIDQGVIRTVQDRPDLVKKILVSVKKQGVSRTLGMVRDKLDQLTPLGYSGAGVVLEVGEQVNDLSAGDRVACAGVGYANHADYSFIPRNLVTRIPKKVEFTEAAFVALGAIALQGFRRTGLQLGESAYIVGLGLVGQLTVQLLKTAGIRAIGTDLSASKVELAKSMGLDEGFVSGDVDIRNKILNFSQGRGVDAIIVCASSKNEEFINQTLEFSKDKGRLVIVGDVPIHLNRDIFYTKEMDLAISRSYGPGRYDHHYEENGTDYPFSYVRWTENRNMESFLELLAANKVDTKSLTSKFYPIENAELAYEDLKRRKEEIIAILLKYSADDSGKSDDMRITLRTESQPIGKDTFTVSIAGTGDMVRSVHLHNLKKIRGLKIRGIMSMRGITDSRLAEKYQAQFVTNSYKELIEDSETDVILIASRHHLHAQMVVEAISKGKHIFVEKPLSLSLEECAKITEAFNRNSNHVKVMVGFNRRFSPITQNAKKIIDGNNGTKIISIRINAKKLPIEHWTNSVNEGGGMLLGEGCHFFDLLHFLLNEEPVQLNAISLSGANQDIAPYSNFSINIQFDKGSVGSFIYTTMGNTLLPKERIEIFTGGNVIIIDDFQEFSIMQNKRVSKKYSVAQKGLLEELEAFYNYLKLDDFPVPDINDGTRATRCGVKAMESMKLRKNVLL